MNNIGLSSIKKVSRPCKQYAISKCYYSAIVHFIGLIVPTCHKIYAKPIKFRALGIIAVPNKMPPKKKKIKKLKKENLQFSYLLIISNIYKIKIRKNIVQIHLINFIEMH